LCLFVLTFVCNERTKKNATLLKVYQYILRRVFNSTLTPFRSVPYFIKRVLETHLRNILSETHSFHLTRKAVVALSHGRHVYINRSTASENVWSNDQSLFPKGEIKDLIAPGSTKTREISMQGSTYGVSA